MNQTHDNIGFKNGFKHDRFGLIYCANCGFEQTSNSNGICDRCLREIKYFGKFRKRINGVIINE